jgi:putative membrane protein
MIYLWLKVFHIVGIVVWFSGLFYLVRLFVYHVEADRRTEPDRSILQSQFQLMEQRLYSAIATPGMVVTAGVAIGMLAVEPTRLGERWLQVKLVLVASLVVYHIHCDRILKQLATGKCQLTSQNLRVLNEVPTVQLIAIVLLAIFQHLLPVNIAVLSIGSLIIVMAVAIQLYARKRQRDGGSIATKMG